MNKVLVIFTISWIVRLSTATEINSTCITKSGVIGVCKIITECEEITENLNSGEFSDLTACNFDGSIGIFCCPINSSPIHSQLTKSCQKVINMREQLKPNFAIYDENSIVSSINELPFMAQIFLLEKGFLGSGVLLTEKFVLTSAHIVYIRRSLPHVILGKTLLDDQDDLIGLDIGVKQVIPHELYIPREIYFDIALLHLERSIKFRDYIWPACLYNFDDEHSKNKELILSGWKSNGRKINELMKGKVLEVKFIKCQEFYKNDTYRNSLPNGLTKNVFCAEINNCKKSPDSDGPIFTHINNTFFIYGFSTLTNTKCHSHSPGIYTKISDTIDWIENIINS